MKKMISLAAMFAALSYASPASAALNISGDAATRLRGEFKNSETAGGTRTTLNDDLKFQYQLRLRAAADLGDGYFFKTQIANEETTNGGTPGWSTVSNGNGERFQLEVNNLYFGHMAEECHYMVGRLPLNSFNNPIFDLALYPIPLPAATFSATAVFAVDVPVYQWNYDRIFGLNYGTKIGSGELNATLVVFDNHSATGNTAELGDGVFNDGYALHATYKTSIGNVTIDPQAIILLTDGYGSTYSRVSPTTFGTNISIPAGKSKIGLSGFYTICKDDNGTLAVPAVSTTPGIPNTFTPLTTSPSTTTRVDYSGYLLRVKGESGPLTAWVDYNRTVDKTFSETTYNNIFVWAQYNINIYQSANGAFNLTPTIRYRASGRDIVGTVGTEHNNMLRTELVARMSF